jgi:hypothetical protein
MSIRAERWVRERRAAVKAGPFAAAVLKELAYRHSQETGRCDPSVLSQAGETQLSERAVRKALRVLETAKLLRTVERKERSGWGRRNLRNRYSFPGMLALGALSWGHHVPCDMEVKAPSS